MEWFSNCYDSVNRVLKIGESLVPINENIKCSKCSLDLLTQTVNDVYIQIDNLSFMCPKCEGEDHKPHFKLRINKDLGKNNIIDKEIWFHNKNIRIKDSADQEWNWNCDLCQKTVIVSSLILERRSLSSDLNHSIGSKSCMLYLWPVWT